MGTPKNSNCRKNQYQKVSFNYKLKLIDEIANGQISVNHASKKYNISRSSINYWISKLSNFESKTKSMSKNDEIKTLKERIEELEFIKEFQQSVIADFEQLTGDHLSKKYLPEVLAKEIEQKRKLLTK